jgi:predicted dehydrogenase
METIARYPQLELAGVWDHDPARLAAFTGFHGVRGYGSYDDLLADDSVRLVLNLTPPGAHWAVSSRALDAGRHVYSEKPLATTMEDARDLVDRAERAGVTLAGAPGNHLSDAVDVLEKALADESATLGRPLVVYAEMDDGMVPGLRPETWRSASGAPWPVRDEYEVGCTLEHAGYQIAPLVRLFGPVRRVTAYNACLLPEKIEPYGGTELSPDFSVGLLEFDDGVVARLTNSILAPADRSLRVVCEHAVLTVADVWEYDSPVRLSPTGMRLAPRVARKLEQRISRLAPGVMLGRRLRGGAGRSLRRTGGGHKMDFARGVAQVVDQLEQGAPVAMDAHLALHVTEVTLALAGADSAGGQREMSTAALVGQDR